MLVFHPGLSTDVIGDIPNSQYFHHFYLLLFRLI
jgi:hypothetical protein